MGDGCCGNKKDGLSEMGVVGIRRVGDLRRVLWEYEGG